MKKYTDKEIEEFIAKIFVFLESQQLCFNDGAFVIEDDKSQLFNLLTFNSFHRPYSDEKCGLNYKNLEKSVSYKQTKTHGIFLDKYNIIDCYPDVKITFPGCKKNKCVKFERAIDISNICNVCPSNFHSTNPLKKRVILYYPFVNPENQKQYLYMKLEPYPLISIRHGIEAIKAYTKKPESGRRERELYTDDMEISDIIFYESMSKKHKKYGINVDQLYEYNRLFRTDDRKGKFAEFFVSNELLKYFFDHFLLKKRQTMRQICKENATKTRTRKHKKKSSRKTIRRTT